MAVMDLEDQLSAGIVLDEAAGFDQGDKQQLTWGYPSILWGGAQAPEEGVYIPTFRRRRR